MWIKYPLAQISSIAVNLMAVGQIFHVLMRLKFQEQSEMKLVNRIIPIAKRIGAGTIIFKIPNDENPIRLTL
jgi:hypothetical protein